MKKLCLLSFTFLLILFIIPLNAQFKMGPKAGINIANIVGFNIANSVEDYAEFMSVDLESRTGFTLGVFCSYQFSNSFAFQPELFYTMKGATLNMEGVDVTISLDYIEVPVLLKFIIPLESSSVRPSLFAGPAIGLNINAKIKAEADGESMELDLEKSIKSGDFSLVFGGGIGFMIDKNELGFDIRYILGLSTIDDSTQDADVKNSVISISAYFGFSLQ